MCKLRSLLNATPVEGKAVFPFPGCVGRSLPVVVCAHIKSSASMWREEAIARQVAARNIASNHVRRLYDFRKQSSARSAYSVR